MAGKSKRTAPARLMKHVAFLPNGCWERSGSPRGHMGYTSLNIAGRVFAAHRYAYELFIGPIPDGLTIDHLCRNPKCVNPLHLEPVTNVENIRRGRAAEAKRALTHCKYGHEFSAENTHWANGGRHRICRACSRLRTAKFRATKAADRSVLDVMVTA